MLLAGALFALDLPRVWVTSPVGFSVRWDPSALAIVLVAFQTWPLAVRRLAPVPVLVVTTAAVVAYSLLDGQPEPDYLSVLIALYTVASAIPQRASALWCAGLAAILVPFTIAQVPTVLAVFRGVVLVVLVWALGVERRRAILDRALAAEERAERDARTRALRAARRDALRRERIARNLHDVLARSLATIVAQGEALRRAPGAEAPTRIDVLVRSGREALAAARGVVTALDHDQAADAPADWDGLLAAFEDSGLAVEADPALFEIPLDTKSGRCLHRVVHEGLTNALRHAGPTSTVRIAVEVAAAATTVRLTNDRTGPPDRPAAPPGYGLLSLRHDVAALGGALDHGIVDDGWELSVRLPVAQATSTGPDAADAPAGHTRIPLVIADDHPMIREGLRLLLHGRSDIEVIAELASGRELLDFLGADLENPNQARPSPEPHPPAHLVVLLDLVMPDLDGLDVLAALRRRHVSRRPRVLVLTTYDDETRVRGALALGADGYLLKECTGHQLVTAIRSVAGGLTAFAPAARDIGLTDAGPGPRATAELRPKQPLTRREAEVLDLLGEGLSNRAIADQLHITERTVKIHVSNVLSKLDVESRTQAALLVRRRS